MLIRVTHETVFEYADEVTHSVMEVRLTPVTQRGQTMREHTLTVNPRVALHDYRDYFGNQVQFFTLSGRHHRITVTSKSLVDTYRSSSSPDATAPWGGMLFEFLQFGGPVVRRPELAEIAAEVRRDDPLQQLQALNEHIFKRLRYRPNATTVESALDEVLAGGEGVCQDFAHLMIGVCRQMEVPARYVSGYILTNRASERGMDASHAWCECYVPGLGWIGLDPTNNLLVDDRYVAVAVGRSYRDVPPTKGVYRGAGDEVMTVAVHTELAA